VFFYLLFQRLKFNCGKVMADATQIDGTHQPVYIFNGSRFRCGNKNAVSGGQEKIKRVEGSTRPEIQNNIFVFEFGYGLQRFNLFFIR